MTSSAKPSNKPKIGYWNLRARGSSLKYLLSYCKVDFEDVQYDTAPDGSSWFGVKNSLGLAFPNIPYLIDGDIKLTENIAIHQYIAQAYNPVLAGKSLKDRGRVYMLGLNLNDTKVAMHTKSFEPTSTKATIGEIGVGGIKPVVAFLGSKAFLIGDYPTWPDFYFLETIFMIKYMLGDGNELYKIYPTLEAYVKKMSELAGLKEFLNSSKFIKGPFSHPMAAVN